MLFKQLFQKNKPPEPAPSDARLELLSMHIPKTAGTSFRNMLKLAYGESSVMRVDINNKLEVRLDNELYTKREVPAGVRILHGHFSRPKIYKAFDLPEDLPMITWLRDPVERVISNYYYLEGRLIDILKENERGTNIRPKMQKTLVEYASVGAQQNTMSRHCEGVDLKDLLFVGLNEHFSEDASYLSKLLGWQSYEEYHHNATSRKPREVSAADREAIASMNQKDVELYRYAQELRAERLAKKQA